MQNYDRIRPRGGRDRVKDIVNGNEKWRTVREDFQLSTFVAGK